MGSIDSLSILLGTRKGVNNFKITVCNFTYGMGWMDGRGVKTVLQFCLYFKGILKMFLSAHIKNLYQNSYGFQILMPSWRVGVCFSKLKYVVDFSCF